MTRRALCPGSFDPPHLGHLDIVERASALFDEVTMAVLINKKKQSFFTVEERIDMLREVTAPLGNVIIDSHHGLLVDYCRSHEIPVIVKGLRAISDYEYEQQMAQMNNQLAGVETMFMTTDPQWTFLSSSLVKEVATYGGDVTHLVSPVVNERLLARIKENS